jgi:uncharacterized membrane protein (DUF106 family)
MDETPTPQAFPIQRFIIITLGMLVILMFIDPTLRETLSILAAGMLDPLIGFGGTSPVVTLFLAALVTSLVSTASRHYFMDWVDMARFQKVNSAIQKEWMAAVRAGHTNKAKKIQEQRQAMAGDTFVNLKSQMKSMAITFFVILIMFSWMATFVAEKAASPMFSVPWSYSVNFGASTLLPHWILLYGLFSYPFGMLLTRIFKYFSFSKTLANRVAEAADG